MYVQHFSTGKRRQSVTALSFTVNFAGFALLSLGATSLAGCQVSIVRTGPGGQTGRGGPTTGAQTPVTTSPGMTPGTTTPGTTTPAACQNGDSLPIGFPIQRINNTQFSAIVSQLFGSKISVSSPFPVPSTSDPYTTYSAANPTGEGESQTILEASEAVAMQVVDTVPACTSNETTCATAYLKDLDDARVPPRAHRPTSSTLVMGAYTHARASMAYAESVGVGVETILQMPQFLYLLEQQPTSPTGAPIALSGSEVASRMALLYWNGLPDDALLQSAAKGELANPTNRVAQAQRMLDDPRAKGALEGFLQQWLTVLNFNDTLHTADVKAALVEALGRDIDDALNAPNGLTALITSSRTWVNSVLETFYGLSAKSTGPTDWRSVDLDPNQRAGLLTNPLLLTKDAHGADIPSPILRGKFVRLMLMCDTIPSPPPNAQALQASIAPPTATIREQSQARINSSACGPCHSQMDPIGFGFSAFDGLGRYVPTVGGQPVDVSGHVQSTSELGGDFVGVRDLAQKLAQSPKAEACLATQWMRYAFGDTETTADTCQIQALTNRFQQQGHSLKALFAQLSALDGFTSRSSGSN